MALTLAPMTFGRPQGQASTAKEDRPKANFWLNVGYIVNVGLPDGTSETKFVSLPYGIPLDTMEDAALGRNLAWNQFQSARNDLKKQLVEYASTLKPGEEVYLDPNPTPGALVLQLRRVEGPVSAPSADENPFAMKLALTS